MQKMHENILINNKCKNIAIIAITQYIVFAQHVNI